MNWDAIAAVAELLGALGVVASLIYLAVQIRQNTRSLRMASHRGVAGEFQQSNLAAIQDPQIAELLVRGLGDASSLSEVERLRFEGLLVSIFRTYEELFQLHRGGLADDELWESRERSMMRWLSFPGVRDWWLSDRSDFFIDSFRTHVADRLSQPAAQQGAAADRRASAYGGLW